MKHQGFTKVTLVKVTISALLITSLLGCQATRRGLNFETSAAITITAGEDVNPDMDGRSSPIVIRVFKLADARQFQREEFLNLYENADERLGTDLIDTVVLKELIPGESRQENLPLSPDVHYLGFLGEYIQYQKAHSVIVVPVKDHHKNAIDIHALRLRLIDGNNSVAYNQRSTTADHSDRNARADNASTLNTHGSDDSGPHSNTPEVSRQSGYDSFRETAETANEEKEFWGKIKDH